LGLLSAGLTQLPVICIELTADTLYPHRPTLSTGKGTFPLLQASLLTARLNSSHQAALLSLYILLDF
jgi:hypothetical protein